MIALLRPDFDVQNAYYGSVQRVMDMAYLLPTFLLNSTLPILSERDAKGQDTKTMVGKTFCLVLLLGIVAFLFSILWAAPLMELLTRESYLSTATHPGSDTALRLLSLPMLLNGVVLFSFYAMLTKNAWRPLVASLAVGGVASLLLNWILIPDYGFVGAGITSIAVHLLLSILLLPQSLRILPMRLSAVTVSKMIAFCLLLAGFLALAAPLLGSSLLTAAGLVLATLWIGILAWILGFRKEFL